MDETTEKVKIGQRIAALREERSLTRIALARLIGVDGSRLLRIERGHEQPTAVQVKSLAIALGVSTDVILRGEAQTEYA